jgi:hypothetical protein
MLITMLQRIYHISEGYFSERNGLSVQEERVVIHMYTFGLFCCCAVHCHFSDIKCLGSVKEENRFSSHYDVRISVHPNELIASLTEPPIHRRLRRYWPHDLLVRF